MHAVDVAAVFRWFAWALYSLGIVFYLWYLNSLEDDIAAFKYCTSACKRLGKTSCCISLAFYCLDSSLGKDSDMRSLIDRGCLLSRLRLSIVTLISQQFPSCLYYPWILPFRP